MLIKNIDVLHRLAAALLEYETISGDEVAQIVKGQKINRVAVVESAVEAPLENKNSEEPVKADSEAGLSSKAKSDRDPLPESSLMNALLGFLFQLKSTLRFTDLIDVLIVAVIVYRNRHGARYTSDANVDGSWNFNDWFFSFQFF